MIQLPKGCDFKMWEKVWFSDGVKNASLLQNDLFSLIIDAQT